MTIEQRILAGLKKGSFVAHVGRTLTITGKNGSVATLDRRGINVADSLVSQGILTAKWSTSISGRVYSLNEGGSCT
jgi:hypothetical protein